MNIQKQDSFGLRLELYITRQLPILVLFASSWSLICIIGIGALIFSPNSVVLNENIPWYLRFYLICTELSFSLLGSFLILPSFWLITFTKKRRHPYHKIQRRLIGGIAFLYVWFIHFSLIIGWGMFHLMDQFPKIDAFIFFVNNSVANCE